jgi:hypothetical protein
LTIQREANNEVNTSIFEKTHPKKASLKAEPVEKIATKVATTSPGLTTI